MTAWLAFALGIFLGATIGLVFGAAIATAASMRDQADELERLRRLERDQERWRTGG